MIRLRTLNAGAFPWDATRRRISESLTPSGTLYTAFWGVADQATVSALNFVTMLLLARELAPKEFGEFVLLYTTLLFSNSFQTCLVTYPHNVIGASKQGIDYVVYTSTCAITQTFLSWALAACVALAAGIAFALGKDFALVLLLLSPTVVAWQAQEFVRRVLYTEGRSRGALINDVVSYGGQAVLTVALWATGLLTEETALSAIAITSAIAVLLGLWQLRGHIAPRFEMKYLRENWEFGRWLWGANLSTWLSGQSYRFIIAFALGTAATAKFAIGDLCMRPVGVLNMSLDSLLPNRFARALSSGNKSMRVRKVLTATAPIVIVYALFISSVGPTIVDKLYGGKYGDMRLLLILFSISYSLQYINMVVGAMVRARRETRIFFVATAYTAILTLCFGWLYVKLFGVEGALLGGTVNILIFTAIVLRYAYRRRTTA